MSIQLRFPGKRLLLVAIAFAEPRLGLVGRLSDAGAYSSARVRLLFGSIRCQRAGGVVVGFQVSRERQLLSHPVRFRVINYIIRCWNFLSFQDITEVLPNFSRAR